MNSSFLSYPIYALPAEEFDEKNCKGSNQKKLLVVYKTESDDKLEFLGNILKAVSYQLDNDTHTFGVAQNSQLKLNKIIASGLYTDIFIFGILPTDLGLNFEIKAYEIKTFKSINILLANALGEIESNQNIKGQLWNCLKLNYLNK